MASFNDGIKTKLDHVRTLKEGYGIGSYNALTYLRVTEDYERLRNDVVTSLREKGITYFSSSEEVSNLCDLVTGCLDTLLEGGTGDVSTILTVTPYSSAFDHFIEQEWKSKEGHERLTLKKWGFDYLPFLVRYFTHYTRNSDSDLSFRTALAQSLDPAASCLVNPEGIRTGFTYFIKQGLSFPYESLLEILLKEKGYYDFVADDWDDGVFEMDDDEDSNPDIDIPRDFYLWLFNGEDTPFFSVIDKESLRRVTEEKKSLLLFGGSESDSLFRRAEREHTLNYQGTSRRIALHYLLSRSVHSREGLDELLDSLRERVKDSQTRYDSISKDISIEEYPNFKPLILETEERMLKERRYALRAILSNQHWLMRQLEI